MDPWKKCHGPLEKCHGPLGFSGLHLRTPAIKGLKQALNFNYKHSTLECKLLRNFEHLITKNTKTETF